MIEETIKINMKETQKPTHFVIYEWEGKHQVYDNLDKSISFKGTKGECDRYVEMMNKKLNQGE